MKTFPRLLLVISALSATPLMADEAGDIGEPFGMVEGFESPRPALRSFSTFSGTTLFSHGNPTDYEQLMLEMINRARADPLAEAARLEIDLNQGLEPGTISDSPKPPLAFNHWLIDSARAHSQWMLDVNVFSHTGVDGSSPGDRMAAAGYPFSGGWAWGENVSWRGTTGTPDLLVYTGLQHDGLFRSPGHRVNILNSGFSEIGVGGVPGVFSKDGTAYNAFMITQNFAHSGGTPGPLLTGVVFDDLNGNGVFDIGEGMAGVGVELVGGAYHTLTSDSGGYALPYPNAGVLQVVFESPGIGGRVTRFVDSTGHNIKLDVIAQDVAPRSRKRRPVWWLILPLEPGSVQ